MEKLKPLKHLGQSKKKKSDRPKSFLELLFGGCDEMSWETEDKDGNKVKFMMR